MNKENCALKLVNEIILYYDARSKKHQIPIYVFFCARKNSVRFHVKTPLILLNI